MYEQLSIWYILEEIETESLANTDLLI
jgi:hypothetical protein